MSIHFFFFFLIKNVYTFSVLVTENLCLPSIGTATSFEFGVKLGRKIEVGL
ncbi:unnamed protein product, partial [Arabidopsis halleri]